MDDPSGPERTLPFKAFHTLTTRSGSGGSEFKGAALFHLEESITTSSSPLLQLTVRLILGTDDLLPSSLKLEGQTSIRVVTQYAKVYELASLIREQVGPSLPIEWSSEEGVYALKLAN